MGREDYTRIVGGPIQVRASWSPASKTPALRRRGKKNTRRRGGEKGNLKGATLMGPRIKMIHCSWIMLFVFFGFLVLFIFTGGLQFFFVCFCYHTKSRDESNREEGVLFLKEGVLWTD